MHAPILSQSQLDQLDQYTIACTPETSETSEWHNLWWCIRNVPGDVCRYLYFMRFSLLLWLFLPTLALLDYLPHHRGSPFRQLYLCLPAGPPALRDEPGQSAELFSFCRQRLL